VRLGEHQYGTDADAVQLQEFDVDAVIQHPDFNVSLGQNDLAIIRLAGRVDFTANVQPICLPTFPPSQNLSDSLAFVAGWGRTKEGGSGVRSLVAFGI